MASALPLIPSNIAADVARDLSVAHESWMQDWPLEVASPSRLEEFVSRCEVEGREEHRTAILALILASLDEAFAGGSLH